MSIEDISFRNAVHFNKNELALISIGKKISNVLTEWEIKSMRRRGLIVMIRSGKDHSGTIYRLSERTHKILEELQ